MLLISTTPEISGYHIVKYQDVVFANVYVGLNALKDIGAGIRNIFGGRSKGYEESLNSGFDQAKVEIAKAAEKVNANAIVGLTVDIESPSGMGLITVTGTAVVVEPDSSPSAQA